MRIGIDMLALQSPGSRNRGVGRFGLRLAEQMLARGADHEFVLLAHDGFPLDSIPSSSNATLALLKPEPEFGERYLRDAMERLARANPHKLDALVMLNPFELCPYYDPPTRRPGPDGLVLAAVMHDLIPFLYQEQYLSEPLNAAWNYRRLKSLRHYDLLLTNSHATRLDCQRMIDLPADRVVTIGGAGNAAFFTPDRTLPPSRGTRLVLNRLGIRRQFVYCVAGMDERKNLRGLLKAFSLLPAEIRSVHQLVLTCFMSPEYERFTRDLASELGITESVILTGEVDDPSLRILYQRCAAFAFPSRYEGLGLPLLEAMLCGAAVVAGNNSSQIEVVGDAGLLANAEDPSDIAAQLVQVLADPLLNRSLGSKAIEHARTFRWEDSADRALGAIEQAVQRSRRPSRRMRLRPRLAVVSPWPPKGSGISDYAMRLVDALRDRYSIDLYHDAGYVPDRALASPDFACFDHRLFERRAAVLGYRGVLYQMGNSFYHGFLYEMLLRHPGIVTLHDFNLAGFQYWRAHQGDSPLESFAAEIAHCEPERAEELRSRIERWGSEPGGVQGACVRRKLNLNRRLFEAADSVVVHSPWCLDQVRTTAPHLADKIRVVPMGATPRQVAPAVRAATRQRFGLPEGALILGSFGHLTRDKMNVEAIRAFARLQDSMPADSMMIFVGLDWEGGQARGEAARLGLGDRVRFLGRQDDDAFEALIAAVDVGIALRRPPTFGETSAALLDLLRHGIPTIVTDVATFACYPDEVVHKVRWDSDAEGFERLVRVMGSLAMNPSLRAKLGRSAWRHVVDEHGWPRAADLYSDVIEQTHAGRRLSA